MSVIVTILAAGGILTGIGGGVILLTVHGLNAAVRAIRNYLNI